MLIFSGNIGHCFKWIVFSGPCFTGVHRKKLPLYGEFWECNNNIKVDLKPKLMTFGLLKQKCIIINCWSEQIPIHLNGKQKVLGFTCVAVTCKHAIYHTLQQHKDLLDAEYFVSYKTINFLVQLVQIIILNIWHVGIWNPNNNVQVVFIPVFKSSGIPVYNNT